MLRQARGEDFWVNVAEIRAIFEHGTGSSLNIGTAANIPVEETPRQILARIADAFGDSV